ncbi:acyl carrier protein [Nocardia wallacei]|uniref:acyl carrier protein n=1 Tax=Nocardia wallacei TaxID=480035 RepID=UPI002453FA55|nr:acyl carrier protein [Nocardia wallacei]
MITASDISALMTGIDTGTETLEPHVPLQDQGVDSMDMTTLLTRIEKTYDITIPTATADELHSLDQLAEYVNSVRT